MRITKQDLERKVELLNHITGNPKEPYTFSDPDSNFSWMSNNPNMNIVRKCKHNPGCYHIDKAYSGYELVQMHESGGVSDVLNTGHIPKKELYNLIDAFMEGIIRTKSNKL